MNLSDLKNSNNEAVEVTPEQMGFKPKEVEPVDNRMDDEKALDIFEKEVIPRKKREMEIFNELIEENDGHVTKQEINEAMGLGFVNDELYKDEPQQLNIEPMQDVITARKKKGIKVEDEDTDEYDFSVNATESHEDQPLNNYDDSDLEEDDLDEEEKDSDLYANTLDESYDKKPLENEGSNDEEDTNVDIKESINKIDKNKILTMEPKKEEYQVPKDLSSIEFPEDEEEDDDDNENTDNVDRDSEEINTKLREAVRSKIKPVAKKYNLSAFTVVKKPVALNAVLENVETPNQRYADWVDYNTGVRFRMLGFTGAEIDKLNNPGGNRMQSETTRYKMLYDHIIDAKKPETMEQWAKSTSFFGIEHYWFGAFRSTFEGAAYMPITNCPTSNKHVFLTDNLDIMDFVKFSNDDAKNKFGKIYNNGGTNKGLYKTDIVPISEDFAVSFREPSIYNMVFEIAQLDQAFVNKYRDIISLITFIDDIYYINKKTMQLEPIGWKYYNNNVAKTTKSRIIQFAKVLRKISSDQYHAILMYIQQISEKSDDVTYQIPETTCPECKSVIPATPIAGNDLVFTRHQLAALAVL